MKESESSEDVVQNIAKPVSELCTEKRECTVTAANIDTNNLLIDDTKNHIEVQYECKQIQVGKNLPIMEDKITRLWHNQEKELSMEDVRLALQMAKTETHRSFDRSLESHSSVRLAAEILNHTIDIKSATANITHKDTRVDDVKNSEKHSLGSKMILMIIIGSTFLVTTNFLLMIVLIQVQKRTSKYTRLKYTNFR